MIFNVTSGGGGGLNLKVVGGTTQPTNPRENTIWVNTATAITGYVLSPTQPETGTEGLVWLKTADSGVEINVGRKNAVLLHLAAGKLYTGGKWANINGWVYANSLWTQFAKEGLMVFDRTQQEYADISGNIQAVTDAQYISMKDAAPYIQMAISGTSTITRGYQWKNPVDVTEYSTMEVVGYATAATDKFGLSTKLNNGRNDIVTAASQTFGTERNTMKIDISSLTGNMYVGFTLAKSGGSIYVESVYLR